MFNIYLIPVLGTLIIAMLVGVASRRSQSRGFGLAFILLPGAWAMISIWVLFFILMWAFK